MNIHYVSCSHQFYDDYGDVEVPSMTDHNDHTNWLNGHEERLIGHDAEIKGVKEKVAEKADAKDVKEQADRIECVEKQIEKMPQTLRETLDQLLKEMLADKLEMGAEVVEGLKKDVNDLREEREKVSAQLADLKQQREGMKAELEEMRKQFDDAKKTHEELLKKIEGRLKDVEDIGHKMNDDFSMQVAEFKLSVPVPKKFAKFLFVQPELCIDEPKKD